MPGERGRGGGGQESIVDLDIEDLELAGRAAADMVSFLSMLGVGDTTAKYGCGNSGWEATRQRKLWG